MPDRDFVSSKIYKKEGEMIAEIGLMVGFYIITRMVSFLMRKGERKESIAVYFFAVLTILITIFVIYDFSPEELRFQIF
jgi:hypothetical protein